jgi:hypothetical protein
MSPELRDARYELRAKIPDLNSPVLSNDTAVWYLDRSMIVQCRSLLYIGRNNLSWLIIRDLYQLMIALLYRTIISQRWRDFFVYCTEPFVSRIL